MSQPESVPSGVSQSLVGIVSSENFMPRRYWGFGTSEARSPCKGTKSQNGVWENVWTDKATPRRVNGRGHGTKAVTSMQANGIEFAYDDGGREAAGFKGQAGDCVTRAIAIATGLPYREVYDSLYERALGTRKYMARLELQYGGQARRHVTPRSGMPREVYEPFLFDLGWIWEPTMGIGSGCRVHLRADELPDAGDLIVRVTKHLCAVRSGVLRDTHDCSRDGTRCVYGFYGKAVC